MFYSWQGLMRTRLSFITHPTDGYLRCTAQQASLVLRLAVQRCAVHGTNRTCSVGTDELMRMLAGWLLTLMNNNGEWFVTSEHALVTMKHARLPSAVWDPRQEALKQSFHPPLMVVNVKGCIVSLLPCQAHDRQTQPRSRRSLPARQPARATDSDPTTEWRPTLHGTAENDRWDHHVHVRAARRPSLGSQPPSSNPVSGLDSRLCGRPSFQRWVLVGL